MSPMSVHVGEQFYNDARVISEVQTRSIDQQIEHWGKIGKIAEGNPDLSYATIKGILIGMQQSKVGGLYLWRRRSMRVPENLPVPHSKKRTSPLSGS